MPPLSTLAIRAALLHLGVGLTLGALLLANKGVSFAPFLWRFLPAHMELLMVGWTVQLALAVAHYIIPRFRGGNFGRLWLAKLSFVLLNAGVLCVALAPFEILPPFSPLLGRLLEAGAVLAFALYVWPRIRPLGH